MLLQLSVANFKSIKEPVILSLVATKDTLHEEYIHWSAHLKVLPTSLIIGTNGAGKSNLFRAIKYLQSLLRRGIEEVKVHPHLLSAEDEPTTLDIQFTFDEKRFVYGIDLVKNSIQSEFLIMIENGGETPIFINEKGTLTMYPPLVLYTDKVKEALKTEKFVLPLLYDLTDNRLVKQVYNFLTQEIIVIMSEEDDESTMFEKARLEFLSKDLDRAVNQYLQDIDIGIKGFKREKDEIVVQYDKADINLQDESRGVKKLFTLLVFINNILNTGKVLLFDELEKHLHPAFLLYFINLFNDATINRHHAQLVFSSHNTSVLDLKILRRDQIWFMDRDQKTLATVCYSLYEIDDVFEKENVEQGYRLGKYGATYEYKHGGVTKDEEE